MVMQLISLFIQLTVILVLIAIALSIATAKWRSFRNVKDAYYALLKWIFITIAITLWRPEKRDGIGQQASPEPSRGQDER